MAACGALGCPKRRDVAAVEEDASGEALLYPLESDLGHHSSGKWLTITNPIVPMRITTNE